MHLIVQKGLTIHLCEVMAMLKALEGPTSHGLLDEEGFIEGSNRNFENLRQPEKTAFPEGRVAQDQVSTGSSRDRTQSEARACEFNARREEEASFERRVDMYAVLDRIQVATSPRNMLRLGCRDPPNGTLRVAEVCGKSAKYSCLKTRFAMR